MQNRVTGEVWAPVVGGFGDGLLLVGSCLGFFKWIYSKLDK